MVTVKQVLARKGTDVETIGPDASVYEALVRMAQRRIGALVVVEDDRPVGVISERDYARKVILHGRSSRETRVGDIMSREIVFVRRTNTIRECMALMTEYSVRHLPVIEGGRLHGIVSIGDVVKELISDQEFIIGQLEQFIMGRHA